MVYVTYKTDQSLVRCSNVFMLMQIMLMQTNNRYDGFHPSQDHQMNIVAMEQLDCTMEYALLPANPQVQ